MGVIDVLPNCVSSVYFIYSPKWAWASLGKVCTALSFQLIFSTTAYVPVLQLSGLREIALVQEMNSYGATDMAFQYMGKALIPKL